MYRLKSYRNTGIDQDGLSVKDWSKYLRVYRTRRGDPAKEEDFLDFCILVDLEDGEHIEDSSPSPFEVVANNELCTSLNHNINRLNAKEQFVIKSRYEVDGHTWKSQNELADLLNVTPNRISQLESLALKKLKKMPPSLLLKHSLHYFL